MQALVCTANPERPAELREVDEPTPAPNEALLDVRAAAINRGELRLLAARPNGWRPGQDIPGIVARPAADGSGPPAGTRVVAIIDEAGWSRRAPAPTHRLAPLPESVSFEGAATLGVAGLTALRALRLGGPLLGKRVLVTGASGGVGHFAVQLAARAGAQVTAVVGRPERGEFLKRVRGIEIVVGPDALSGPYDLALESVGGAYLAAALHGMAEDGTIAVFGNSSGEQTPLSFRDFGGHARAKIYGFFVYQSGDRPTFGEDLGLMASLIAEGSLQPQIGFQTNWSDPVPAFTALQERRVDGKAVLQIA